jgi:hypothetical protein
MTDKILIDRTALNQQEQEPVAWMHRHIVDPWYHDIIKAKIKALRALYGLPCPQCKVSRRKTNPSILLPQQRCKVDGYRDNRPRLTDQEWESA